MRNLNRNQPTVVSPVTCPELHCDWSLHNQHSRNFSAIHIFLSLTVIKFAMYTYSFQVSDFVKEED